MKLNSIYQLKKIIIGFLILIPFSGMNSYVYAAQFVGSTTIGPATNSKFPDIEAYCSEVHIASNAGDGNVDRVLYFSKQDTAGNVGIPFLVGRTDGQSDWNTANLAVGANGTVHYVWLRNEADQIMYRSKPAGGNWGPEEVAIGSGNFMHYVNVAAAGNQPVIIWRDGEAIYTSTRTGPGTWSTRDLRSTNSLNSLPGIAISNNGTIGITYASPVGDSIHVFAATRQGSGPWVTQQISTGGGAHSDPSIAVGPNGAFYVAWRISDRGVVPISVRSSTGTWSPPATDLSGATNVAGAPGIAIDIQNGIHVSWANGNGQLEYAYRPTGATSWTRTSPARVGEPIFVKLATSFSASSGILAHGVTDEYGGFRGARYFLFSPR